MIRIKVTNEEKFQKVRNIEFDSLKEIDEWKRLNGHYILTDKHSMSSFGICKYDKFKKELGFIFEEDN